MESGKALLGVLAAFVLGALVVGGMTDGNLMSWGDDNQQEAENPGEGITGIGADTSATLQVSAENQDEDQVSVEGYVWNLATEGNQMSQQTLQSGSDTAFDMFVGQDDYRAIAFDDNYPYAVPTEGTITRKTQYETLEVFEAAATSDINVNFRDGDSSISSVSLGTQEQKSLDGVQVSIESPNGYYNPQVVLVDDPANATLEMNKATTTVPAALDSQYDRAYVIDASSQLTKGEDAEFENHEEGMPKLGGYDSITTDGMTITADDFSTVPNSSTAKVAVLDKATYLNNEEEVAYGVEDDSEDPQIVGLSAQTQTLTVNFE